MARNVEQYLSGIWINIELYKIMYQEKWLASLLVFSLKLTRNQINVQLLLQCCFIFLIAAQFAISEQLATCELSIIYIYCVTFFLVILFQFGVVSVFTSATMAEAPQVPQAFQNLGYNRAIAEESSVTLLVRHLPEAIPHDIVTRLFSHYGASSVRPCSHGRLPPTFFSFFFVVEREEVGGWIILS